MNNVENFLLKGCYAHVSDKVEIVVCSRCNGKGTIEREECVDYHKRDWVTFIDNCKKCNGNGRLKVTTRIVKFPDIQDTETEPYVFGPDKKIGDELMWKSKDIKITIVE